MKAQKDWRSLPMPNVFEWDFELWLKSLTNKARAAEPTMCWSDLSPFTANAYSLHSDIASTYAFLASKNKLPRLLPDDCTPDGFYLKAVESRRRQIGLHHPFTPIPYEQLSPFSQFIYRQLSERVANVAGFTLDDGLGLDDSIDDGLNGFDLLDDGLESIAIENDGLGDGL